MKPRIVLLSGPLKGAVFQITDSELTVGRYPDNLICLEEDMVSRYHLTLRMQDGNVVLVDLQSRNGTSINGVPVSTKVLEHGDMIKVGSTTFKYNEHEETTTAPPSYDDPEVDKKRNARTLRVDRSEAEYPNTDQLQVRILEHVLDLIPVKRAAILLVGRDGEEFVSGTYRVPGQASGAPFPVSRWITHDVLATGMPVITDYILCVPLKVTNTKLGVIYLDNEDQMFLPDGDSERIRLLMQVAAISVAAFGHTRYVEWLEGEKERLQEEAAIDHEMVGDSPKMREVYQIIGKAAPADTNILIIGETGTGKELVARAIHRNSSRKNGPFIDLNCGAIAATLIESELFGSEKGSYTGSVAQQKGKIEIADGGTLFLDEIGEIPLAMQVALLRLIQEGTFQRVGGTRTIKINVRIIAATNRNLEEAIKASRFRADLFYRLQVVTIKMPPLRERRDDIPKLGLHFMQKFSRLRRTAGFTPDARALLHSYDWPGNVRELENAVQRAIVLGDSDHIRPEDLPENLTERKAAGPVLDRTYYAVVNRAKTSVIQEMLDECNGDLIIAAHRLGISHSYLHRLIRNLGIDTDRI